VNNAHGPSANIRPGWKGLPWTNALAYLTKKKQFFNVFLQVTDALDFLPNRAKLAFTKVDETIQQVPPLLEKASNGRPGRFRNDSFLHYYST
jgi:hypothetical protein